METNTTNTEEEYDLFDDDQPCSKASPIISVEENDYLDKDVGYIIELIRFM